MSEVSKAAAPAPSARQEVIPPPADAVVKNEGGKFSCSVDDEALASIRLRAGKLIWRAGEKAYSDFPIDRGRLYRYLVGGIVTEENICTTLRPSNATEKNHNELRKGYMSDRLGQKAAADAGLVGTATPFEISCQEGYGWEKSPYYSGADSCEDVTEEFGGRGLPTAMYSTDLPASQAVSFMSNPDTSPFYTRYADEGPVKCASSSVEGAFFHKIHVWGTLSAEFAMRTYSGEGWSAWVLSNECTTPDGTVHKPSDIMFDFGIRIFLSLDVEVDGKRIEKTLVLSQVAATSEGLLAKLVPSHIPLERFYAGEKAKGVLMDAKARGFKIE